MAGRAPRPGPAIVVDTTYGMTGIRKSPTGRMTLPGGIVVLCAGFGPKHVPEGFVPTELYVHIQHNGRLGQIWRDRIIELLLERMEA